MPETFINTSGGRRGGGILADKPEKNGEDASEREPCYRGRNVPLKWYTYRASATTHFSSTHSIPGMNSQPNDVSRVVARVLKFTSTKFAGECAAGTVFPAISHLTPPK